MRILLILTCILAFFVGPSLAGQTKKGTKQAANASIVLTHEVAAAQKIASKDQSDEQTMSH